MKQVELTQKKIPEVGIKRKNFWLALRKIYLLDGFFQHRELEDLLAVAECEKHLLECRVKELESGIPSVNTEKETSRDLENSVQKSARSLNKNSEVVDLSEDSPARQNPRFAQMKEPVLEISVNRNSPRVSIFQNCQKRRKIKETQRKFVKMPSNLRNCLLSPVYSFWSFLAHPQQHFAWFFRIYHFSSVKNHSFHYFKQSILGDEKNNDENSPLFPTVNATYNVHAEVARRKKNLLSVSSAYPLLAKKRRLARTVNSVSDFCPELSKSDNIFKFHWNPKKLFSQKTLYIFFFLTGIIWRKIGFSPFYQDRAPSDMVYDGYGGHSKVDRFPVPKVMNKDPKRSLRRPPSKRLDDGKNLKLGDFVNLDPWMWKVSLVQIRSRFSL